MKYTFALLLLLLSVSIATTQNELAADRMPEALLENANEVVRSERQVFHIHSLSEGTQHVYKTVTILNPKSEASELVIYYDESCRVDFIEARLLDGQGRLIREADAGEIRDYPAGGEGSLINGDRVKVLDLSHHQYPYTIQYEYSVSLRGLYFINYPDWQIQDFHSSVEQSTFELRLPRGMTLHYRALNIDLPPARRSTGSETVFTWTVKQLRALPEEAYRPHSRRLLPQVLLSADRFEVAGLVGSMADWNRFGAFVYRLYEGRDQLPAAFKEEIRTMTADATGDREKIRRLYRYLQQHTRYVSVQLGLGGWQPFDAGYVYRNKYGDCKALTNFMRTMLRVVDITAYPALIQQGAKADSLLPDFVYSPFNHVILYIPSEDYWLECTSDLLPPNYLGSDNAGRHVLLVTPQGGQLASTPPQGFQENQATCVTTFRLEPDNYVSIAKKSRTTGTPHEVFRYLGALTDREAGHQWLRQTSRYPVTEVESFEVVLSGTGSEAFWELSVRNRSLAVPSGKRLLIPVYKLLPPVVVPPENPQRRWPVVLPEPVTLIDTVVLALPTGCRIETIAGQSTELEMSFAFYSLDIQNAGHSCLLIRTFRFYGGELPPEQYSAFREFFYEVANADQVNLVVYKSPAYSGNH